MNESREHLEGDLSACRIALERCTNSAVLSKAAWAQNRLISFNLWAAGLGAFSRGHNALRKRLAHSWETLETIAILVDSLLVALQRCLQLASKSGGEEPIDRDPADGTITIARTYVNILLIDYLDVEKNLGDSKRAVQALLRSLIDIGLAVRQAGEASRLLKADMSFDKSNFSELEEHLELVLQAQVTFDRADEVNNIVDTIMSSMMGPSQRRLIDANLRRRHRFAWARRRYNNLREPTNDIPLVGSPSQPQQVRGREVKEPHRVQDGLNAQTRIGQSTGDRSASVVDPAMLKPVLADIQSRPSIINKSRTPSVRLTAVTAKLTYPNPPSVVFDNDRENFLCPCCWQALPVDVGRNVSKWKAHLAKDLRPYTCPHAECSTRYDLFADKQSLLTHLNDIHRNISHWQCHLCGEVSEHTTALELKAHIEGQHLDTIRVEDVAAVVEMSSFTKVDLPRRCPVCNGSETTFERTEEGETYLDHICRHLHDFSLRSLPWNDQDQDEDPVYKEAYGSTINELSQTSERRIKVESWLSDNQPSSRTYGSVDRPNTPPLDDGEVHNSVVPMTPEPLSTQSPRLPDLTWRPLEGLDNSSDLPAPLIGRLEDEEYFEDKEENQDISAEIPHDKFEGILDDALVGILYIVDHSDTARSLSVHLSRLKNQMQLYQMQLHYSRSDSRWAKAVRQIARDDGPLDLFISVCEECDKIDTNDVERHSAVLADANDVMPILNTLIGLALDPESRKDPSRLMFAIEKQTHVLNDKVKCMAIEEAQSSTLESIGEAEPPEAQQIARWLSPPDPSTNHNRAKEQRHADTGRWFLQSHAYKGWKTETNNSLWLHGLPGSGKTVLSSIVIEDLKTSSPGKIVLFFYFDFNDSGKQSFEGMLRSLIHQLYHQYEPSRRHLDQLYSSCNEGEEQPYTQALATTLRRMTHGAGDVVIVLDALDEYWPRKDLLSWLASEQQEGVKLFMTSRKEYDIETSLWNWVPVEAMVPIQQVAVDEDIRALVRSRLAADEEFRRWRSRPDLCKEIEACLLERSDGMFRWAACQLDALGDCLDVRDLKAALLSLPRDLDGTYGRSLANIPPRHVKTATRILQFLLFSERPLTLKEAVDVIAVMPDRVPAFDFRDRMPVPEEIVRYCSGLIKITASPHGQHSEDQLELAHFSVKEYLVSDRLESRFKAEFNHSRASAVIVEVSIAYMLAAAQDRSDNVLGQRMPLSRFAAEYWMGHAAVAEHEVVPWVKKLFAVHDAYKYWLCHYDPEAPWKQPANRPLPDELARPLYYACLGGLVRCASGLLNEGADVDARGGRYGNALQAASHGGHIEVVQILLDRGANVNARGGRYGTALQAASHRGHIKVVQLLLDWSADVNALDGKYLTALQAASLRGHIDVVQMLLDSRAEINTHGGWHGSALHAACFEGHDEIVQMLLDSGADVNARGGKHGSALQVASIEGYGKIVEMLLNHGADGRRHRGESMETASKQRLLEATRK